MRFEGIYVPIITTFRQDMSIDYSAWGDVIDWQIESGTHGIIVGGSTGEFFSLRLEERIAQFEFACERVGGRLPVIAGVNDLVASRSRELAAAAKSAGAAALLVAAPPYSLPSQSELAAHCLEIDRAADLPILLYNYPGRTGTSMDREFLQRVAREKNFCAIKESSGDQSRIPFLAQEYPELQLSAGAEDQVLEFFAWGARSWVSVTGNFLPRQAIALYDSCVLKNDFTAGRRMMSRLLPLMQCLERGGRFLQSVKYACELLQRPGGPVRPPLQEMDDPLRARLKQLVDACQADPTPEEKDLSKEHRQLR
ncbi:MAG: dihydrodipicolinate synthase family protein [Woeseia sp.]